MSNYYNENFESFIKGTVDCNMDEVYRPFLKYLKSGSSILDAGCGSGRDSLNFLNLGFSISAFDISDKMVDSATKLTGIAVKKQSFLDITYEDEFDAIWACASLLHLKREDLAEAFIRLGNSLKKDGIMYCSFKLRDEDFSKDGRAFTCFNESSFKSFLINMNLFDIMEIYITSDTRENRHDELWINAIIKKKN